MSIRFLKNMVSILLIVVIVLGFIYLKDNSNKTDDNKLNKSTPDKSSIITATPIITPTKEPLPLSNLKIVIDPAHQKASNTETESIAPWDNTQKAKCVFGSQGLNTGIYEFDLNLKLSLLLKDILTQKGATVIMTHTSNDVNISNRERAIISNNENADIVFIIHHNGFGNQDINGIEVHTRGSGDGTNEYKKRSDIEKKMAAELLDCLILTTGANRRGVYQADNNTSINYTLAPCFVIEVGYLTNPVEELRLVNEDYQKCIINGILYWLLNSKSFNIENA